LYTFYETQSRKSRKSRKSQKSKKSKKPQKSKKSKKSKTGKWPKNQLKAQWISMDLIDLNGCSMDFQLILMDVN